MKSLFKINLDHLGICVSTFCAIHCLVTPFLIILLPFASLTFLEAEGFEKGLLIVSFILAASSLVLSYVRKHRNMVPLLLAGIGFMFFVLGKSLDYEAAEIGFSIIGGIFVVIAHYRNLKLIKGNAPETGR